MVSNWKPVRNLIPAATLSKFNWEFISCLGNIYKLLMCSFRIDKDCIEEFDCISRTTFTWLSYQVMFRKPYTGLPPDQTSSKVDNDDVTVPQWIHIHVCEKCVWVECTGSRVLGLGFKTGCNRRISVTESYQKRNYEDRDEHLASQGLNWTSISTWHQVRFV